MVLENLPYAADVHHASIGGQQRTPCLEGTRVAVLHQIRTWMENKDPDKRIFWLNGMAGIGKTTIVQTNALEAEERGCMIGSFFFCRDSKDLDDARLFPTLSRQLAQQDDDFASSVPEALDQDTSHGRRESDAQFKRLTSEPFISLTKPRRIILFIDALDESSSEERALQVLQILCALANSSSSEITTHLRIFIASRPEPHIQSFFTEEMNEDGFVLHNVEPTTIRADIELYLREELSKTHRRLKIARPAIWPSRDDLDFLAEKSDRIFIYAATAVRFIGDGYSRNPQKQISILRGVRSSSKNPHAALDELYMHVLASAFPRTSNEKDMEDYRHVVGSILFLRQTLSMGTLARFLASPLRLSITCSTVSTPSSSRHPHPSRRKASASTTLRS